MKTLAIPFVTLLLFSACSKSDMPVPNDPLHSAARISGDTVTRIFLAPGERGPVPNEIGPRIPRETVQHHSLGRITGDTLRKVSLTPSEHKPLTNGTGPIRPKR